MKRILLAVVFVGTTVSAAADELAKTRPVFESNIDLLGCHPYPHASVIALQCEGPPRVRGR